ncbi:ribbon-helix-helix protein, CopG family [Lactococcus muris]|uniref:Ribbon-helix-helix protein, CopG family n=1 Tax=Lactococcus muris TaxID=2941330 RepID=A0ABV4D7T6_9LACT
MTEQEKKKRGRPLVGEKPRNKRVEVRLTEDEKKALEVEAKRTGLSISQVVSKLIERL